MIGAVLACSLPSLLETQETTFNPAGGNPSGFPYKEKTAGSPQKAAPNGPFPRLRFRVGSKKSSEPSKSRRRLGRLHGPHPGAVAVVLGRRGGLPRVARAGCLGPLGARWPRGSKGRNGSGHKLMGSIDKTGGELYNG